MRSGDGAGWHGNPRHPQPTESLARPRWERALELARTLIGDSPLDATSVVHMLAVMSAVPGSGAYVAMERIEGTLDGRRGSFFAQHNGVMDRGKPTLDLTVVPDTGTGDLTGLHGRIAIDIVDGKHSYTFDYDFRE